VDLGELTDDGEKDKLKGDSGNDVLIGASGGKSKLSVLGSTQTDVAENAAPFSDTFDLEVATIGVSLSSADGSILPGEHVRFVQALVVLNARFEAYGVHLVELAESTLVDTEILVEIASTSPCGDMAAGVLGCATDEGQITLLAGWDWYTGEDASSVVGAQYDFQTIVTHEIGHVIGLDHSGDLGSVMYFELSSGESRRDLTDQDLRFVNHDGGPEALMAHRFLLVDDHRRGPNTLPAMDADSLRRMPITDEWIHRIDRRHEDERTPRATVDTKTEPKHEELVDQVFSLAGKADAGDVLEDLEGILGETDLRNDDSLMSLNGGLDSRE
jgi:hypothetical protein